MDAYPHPRSEPTPSPEASTPKTDESPRWVNWLTAGIVVGGLYLVAATSPMSQGEWNDLYGRKR
jgi:hypothetical protein